MAKRLVRAVLTWNVETEQEYREAMASLAATSAPSISWTADVPREWDERRVAAGV